MDNVRAVREAVGPDVDILLDMHRRLAPMHAVRIAREIEPYRPFWYEEPVLAENVNELAAVKREINLPVVTGEELYTKFESEKSSKNGPPTLSTPTSATWVESLS